MPSKLKILLGMIGVNILLGAVGAAMGSGSWLMVILSAVIAGLLFKGNNIVRILVLVFSGLGLLLGLLGLMGAFALLVVDVGTALVTLVSVVWGIVVNIFAIYALTRTEVKAYFGAA